MESTGHSVSVPPRGDQGEFLVALLEVFFITSLPVLRIT